MFIKVISLIYEKIYFGDRVPLTLIGFTYDNIPAHHHTAPKIRTNMNNNNIENRILVENDQLGKTFDFAR